MAIDDNNPDMNEPTNNQVGLTDNPESVNTTPEAMAEATANTPASTADKAKTKQKTKQKVKLKSKKILSKTKLKTIENIQTIFNDIIYDVRQVDKKTDAQSKEIQKIRKIVDAIPIKEEKPLSQQLVSDKASAEDGENKKDFRYMLGSSESDKPKNAVKLTRTKDPESKKQVIKPNQSDNEKAQDSEFTIFNTISDSITAITNTLDNIFTLLTRREQFKPEADAKPLNMTQQKDIEKQDKGGFSLGKFGTAIFFAIFSVYPLLLRIIKENREKISDFLQPAFEFVLEDIPKFIFKTIPDFFTETLPTWFKEKFDVAKDFMSELVDNVKTFSANIKKSIGEAIVKVGESMPDWMSGLKKGMTDYGKEMINNADKTLSEAESNKKERQQRRKDRENKQQLEIMAAKEMERRKEQDPRINDYEVTWDKTKNMVMVQFFYEGTDKALGGDVMVGFDAEKSLQEGTLVVYDPKQQTKQENKNANAVPGISPNTPGAPRPVGGGSIPTPQRNESMGSSGSDATPEGENTKNQGATAASSSGASSSPPPAGGTTAPTSNAPDPNLLQNTGNGEELVKQTAAATNPEIDAKANKTTVKTINAKTGRSKQGVLVNGKPHSINDVPDPTPVLGNLTAQLFFVG